MVSECLTVKLVEFPCLDSLLGLWRVLMHHGGTVLDFCIGFEKQYKTPNQTVITAVFKLILVRRQRSVKSSTTRLLRPFGAEAFRLFYGTLLRQHFLVKNYKYITV